MYQSKPEAKGGTLKMEIKANCKGAMGNKPID